ncbi:permease [Bacillus haynesii]|uniref:permease n=1 Tax=Bacillus haynesii TaxID=1925021 RepID=UPI00227DFABF|nr:permease [Bacillus haynesii]MCY8399107.1 permease [Bacillus haynesii]MCY8641085.1 permease [Bacillus haynesii]MCY8667159.1 permease [Bacillus haynesii]MCY9434898.1 permease [Bacillus haynesii]MEC1551398.1 permease [Bacillus haynesii]
MIVDVLKSFLSIALELTVLFIGISFLVSLIQGFIPYDKLNKYLEGKNVFVGAAIALVIAFVTPFCSCSTIPVVVNLLNKKIRFGIVMVFLFSSPVLDPTIITLMGALLGVKVAAAYTVITSVLSVVIGLTLEKMGFVKAVKHVVMSGYEEKQTTFSIKAALRETLTLMKSVYPFLIIGAAIGSVIHGFVPTEWISSAFGGNQWWLVPIAAIIGIPLYIRLSTMIPLSQILMVKGMAIAPVMALMISSAGASLPELTLLNSIFQKRLVMAFVISVIAMSTISGFLFYII